MRACCCETDCLLRVTVWLYLSAFFFLQGAGSLPAHLLITLILQGRGGAAAAAGGGAAAAGGAGAVGAVRATNWAGSGLSAWLAG